jgi:F420H(2)-dependent quinone reductase
MTAVKALKVVATVVLVYLGVVVAFESAIGYFQPTAGSTLVIATIDADGAPHDRVVSRLESDGQLYVAANHWPRAWYNRALENPEVHVRLDGEAGNYRAVPVTGAEHDRVDSEHSLGLVFRILTGFPPRHFVRLDPVGPQAARIRI